ncbi:hypothetical protein JW613_07665 [Streptomyces smyrnaeus]|uniref:Uncharacterized protein n=1 Tax=Streptomyces smyrnaeus TaxID=1387713 RepID=A0ABS3XS95_9ACTN|nr:hypothetical protein [Streptomyces smyrnaeus]MBO8198181.1 hypothetical protein [Streptomyces smyrnaeus]
MTGDDRPTLPPVRLPSDAELARDALAAPLLARAVELTRWARAAGSSGAGIPVGAGGELLSQQLKEAAAHLGLTEDEEAPALAADAWNFAVDTGLLVVDEDADDDEAGGEAGAGASGAATGEETAPSSDEPVGVATPDEEFDGLTGGPGGSVPAPDEILELWRTGLDTVLADAATPSFEELLGGIEGAIGENGEIDPDAIDLDAMDWNPEEETEALDSALGNLYLLTATDPAVAAGSMVPLPVLAASMTVPDGMEEPTDEVLEEVSTAMMRLDEQFRMLEPTGLVAYQPVDEALTREAAEGEEVPGADGLSADGAGSADGADLDEEDVTRYGMVRLTPLGLYGVRERMREAGLDVPAVGDLADAGADKLLAALPVYTEENARSEIESWFAARATAEGTDGAGGTTAAARELLAAARGTDEAAPVRRLACQQALSLAGPEAEPALREVLEDRQLGGLARVWLAERGAADVPQPDEEMVFWLTIDTIAAQVATAGEPDELRELVRDLVDQHAGFFDKAWRVEHPATGDVLETMGRVHPDKRVAKDARKAAFKARSR